jgi:hypothetical protein
MAEFNSFGEWTYREFYYNKTILRDYVDKALDVFLAIGKNPEICLPEKSIWYLQHFHHGYLRRMRGEGVESALPTLLAAFGAWLGNRFDLLVQSQSVFHVVDSYAAGPEDAFDKFYELFECFRQSETTSENVPERKFVKKDRVQNEPKADICGMLRLIRKRPEMWVGYPHFSGVHAYLVGYEGAGGDLGLPKTADEKLYGDFKQWIEKSKFPKGKPRPWFKLILFHSSHDSGFTPSGAYSVFFDLLDDFAKEIGRPGLFEVLR